MLIRLGYDIELEIAQTMAVVAVLNVHPSRIRDLRVLDEIHTSPGVAQEQLCLSEISFAVLRVPTRDECLKYEVNPSSTGG